MSLNSLFKMILILLQSRIYRLLCYTSNKIPILKPHYKKGDDLFHIEMFNSDPWIYHDENWERVIHRFTHRKLILQGKTITVNDTAQVKSSDIFTSYHHNYFNINKLSGNKDRWVYLYLDPSIYNWKNYRWIFRMRLRSFFHELQFGFRYNDFYNRYRFRFQDEYLFFDEVFKGKFHNGMKSVRLPMILNKYYDVTIDVYEKKFMIFIDGIECLRVTDIINKFNTGSIAIILWEKNESNNIMFDIENIHVHELI